MRKYGKLSVAFGFLAGIASVYMLATSETARHVDSYIIQWADTTATTRPQFKNVQSASVVDSLAWITGTGADTTCAFDIYPYMTLWVTLDDTSGDDSTQSVIDFYVAVNNQYRRSKLPVFAEYRRAAQYTVISDTVLNLTHSPIPIGQTGYVTVTGGADNKIESAVKNVLKLSGL